MPEKEISALAITNFLGGRRSGGRRLFCSLKKRVCL